MSTGFKLVKNRDNIVTGDVDYARVVIKWNREYGEWKCIKQAKCAVTGEWGQVASYYSDNAVDARGTAIAMLREPK